jgi:5-methylcytosine-specific restriction protein A
VARQAPRLGRKARRRPKAAEPRGNANARGYGHGWRKARLEWLAENPICRECERKGRTSAASVVDHVIPHRGDQRLFWSRRNWQSLCKPCHDLKTASGQ